MGEEGARGRALTASPRPGSSRRGPLVVAALVIVGALLGWLWLGGDHDKPDRTDRVAANASDKTAPEAPEPDAADNAAANAVGSRKVLLEVTTADGAPVGGASVTLLSLGQRKPSGTTGGEGMIELTVQRPTPVEVKASGYEPQVFPPPAFGDAPEVFWSVKLRARGEATALGGFVHVAGAPVSGAVVVLLAPTPEDSQVTRTSADGRYQFKTAPAAATEVAALAEAFGEVIVERPAGAKELTLELPAPAFVEGTVTDGQGRPLKDVTVRIAPARPRAKDRRLSDLMIALLRDKGRQSQGRWMRRAVGMVETHVEVGDGTFRAGPVAAGTVDVLGYAAGHSPARVEGLQLSAGNTLEGVKLVLSGTAQVVGVVVDRDTGAPIQNARVTASGSMSLPGFGSARSGADGTFVLNVTPDVRQRLQVVARGYTSFEVGGVIVGADEQVEREVALTRGGNKGPHKQREYVGIGASVRKADDGVLVLKTLEGGPARDQLHKGDVIMRVDSTWVDDMDLREAIELLVGEAGTDVEVLVKRPGANGESEEINVVLTRNRVKYQVN